MQPNSGSVSKDKLFVASAKSFLDGAMVTGRYSARLIREFDAHVENGTANIFPIFDEIGPWRREDGQAVTHHAR